MRVCWNFFRQLSLCVSTLFLTAVLASAFVGILINQPGPSRVQASSSGLVASYSFNEGSGTTVTDSSGNGNNGTISGATWTTAGKYGSALSFNGSSSRVTVNDSPSLHLSAGMTLEAWVSPTGVPTYWQDVIYKQNDIYFLEAASSASQHAPAVGATFNSHGDQFVAGASGLAVNTWTHLAATYDGATLRLYVNGVQVASHSMPDSLTTSTMPLQIGGDAAFGQYFKGTIDEVRIYNRALAPSEIQSDMSSPVLQITDTQPPTAPSNLSAISSGPTQINLSWTASTDNVGVTSYLLERCLGAGCTSFSQIATPTGTTYSNTGLTATTSYSYRARARDAAGNLSSYSSVATVVTPAAADTTSPSGPTNLSATPASTTQINLVWTASTDNVGVTAYLLERCLGSGCTTFSQIASPTGTTYSDTSLTASTSYSYRVRATDAAGNRSGYSNVVNVATPAAADTTPPTAPANLGATPISAAQINLSWTASTDNVGVSGYRLERCLGSGCTSFAQIAAPAGTTYSDTSVAASSSYSYRVRASDAAGNFSSYSNLASAATPSSGNTGPAMVSFVQSNYATPQSGQTSVSVTYASAQNAGDLNVIVVGWNDSSATISSVSDSSGNVYSLAVGPTQFSGALTQSIYYAKNIHAAGPNANVFTVKFTSSAVAPDIRILEYSGLDTTNPFDVAATATGNSSSSATPTAAVPNAGDLIVGANIVVSLTAGPGSGFTQRVLTSPDGDIVEDRVASTAGSYSAGAPLNGSAAWIMQMVALKAASVVAPPPPTLVSIAVTPASPSVTQSASLQFTAMGTYSDNSTRNLTASASWASADTTVATISPSTGLASGVGIGTSQITATSGNVTSPGVTLTVTSSTGGGGASAQLVQHVSSSNTRGGGSVNNTFTSPYCYHFQLPNFTTAGNTVVVGFTFNGNPTPSVHDDKGNAYSVRVNYYDSADTQSIGIATAFNIAAGARVVSVCFSSDPGGYTQPMATEFDNVVGIDGPGSASQGSGTSVTAGNLTPTTSGDLVYQVAFSLSVNQSSFTAGSQSNISWNLLSADLLDGWAAQYGLYNSTAAINPTLSMGTSQKWISAGVLLKTGSSGAVPSGMRIVHLVHENIPYHANAGGTNNPFPNPTTVQFPSSGNLLVAMIGGGYLACSVTSVSDNNGNAWAQAGGTQIENGNDMTQAFYAGNATTSGNLRLTTHWDNTDGDFTFFLYDITGAAASPLDTTGGAIGAQSNPGNLTMPFTINPAQAGELVFAEVIWDYNTGAGLVGSGWLFDTNTFDGENVSGPEPIDQNNGWGHYLTTSTSPVGITWQTQYAGVATGPWSGTAVAFKPAP
jgi:fibronectin type 3 domain-containing protein